MTSTKKEMEVLIKIVVGRCTGDITQFVGPVERSVYICEVVAIGVEMGNRGSAAMSGGGGACLRSGSAS